ncbi:hypothetical protein Pfo_024253 [Paulownia fortunei]|nr:hypothetical protein Pfo_024253 [Paulownia fortunei]
MDHPLIIKVKCEEILRRITAYVSKEGILNLDLDRLRRKVRFLFQISPYADFKLRYIDEDGDEIMLFEDSDLCEAITQRLNPLRINVALNNMNETGSESSFKTSSSPNKSAQVEHLSSCMDYANAEVLKSTQNSLGDILSKLSLELVERSACLVLSELIECLSKLAISSPDVVSKHKGGENVSSRSLATGCSTLVQSSCDSCFTKTNSPQPISTEYPELAKCCENQPVENQTCQRTAPDKLNLSLTGDCPKYSAVSLSQAFIPELFSSHFVFDLNVPDFTLFAPNITFSKKLRLCNNGVRAWPYKSKLVWIGGDRLTDEISVEMEIPVDGLPVGKEIDVAVNFRSPEQPGDYISYWKMSLPTGETFAQRIWIRIQVYDPLKYSKELDLNYPPPGCIEDDEDIRYMTAKSVNIGRLKVTAETKKSFPTLITGQTKGKIKSTECQVNGLCTNFLASNISTPVPEPGSGSSGAHLKSISDDEDNDIEHSLLKVLEEMGFNLAHLNKEILRLNSYNLQKTVTDLCGISDWDQVFTELETMGYSKKETEMNSDMEALENLKRIMTDLVSRKIATFDDNLRLGNHN